MNFLSSYSAADGEPYCAGVVTARRLSLLSVKPRRINPLTGVFLPSEAW